jgi:hypothetical protein
VEWWINVARSGYPGFIGRHLLFSDFLCRTCNVGFDSPRRLQQKSRRGADSGLRPFLGHLGPGANLLQPRSEEARAKRHPVAKLALASDASPEDPLGSGRASPQS